KSQTASRFESFHSFSNDLTGMDTSNSSIALSTVELTMSGLLASLQRQQSVNERLLSVHDGHCGVLYAVRLRTAGAAELSDRRIVTNILIKNILDSYSVATNTGLWSRLPPEKYSHCCSTLCLPQQPPSLLAAAGGERCEFVRRYLVYSALISGEALDRLAVASSQSK
uniref:Rubis-subs-bind domain-containing protein n=1 Tax=Macrostomum lignano TaxID=282301 RepID=A0A1I8FCV0_9PLAT